MHVVDLLILDYKLKWTGKWRYLFRSATLVAPKATVVDAATVRVGANAIETFLLSLLVVGEPTAAVANPHGPSRTQGARHHRPVWALVAVSSGETLHVLLEPPIVPPPIDAEDVRAWVLLDVAGDGKEELWGQAIASFEPVV